MVDIWKLLWLGLIGFFRSRASLRSRDPSAAPPLTVLQRKNPTRPAFRRSAYFLAALLRGAKNPERHTIVRLEAVMRWHRAGFRASWRWKRRRRRLRSDGSLAPSVWRVPLWGSPHSWRISQDRHRCRPDDGCKTHGPEGTPSQGWKTFLRNHADGIAAMDLFVVPTISFRLLYGLRSCGIARQVTEAFG
jgi:hypothetical protein